MPVEIMALMNLYPQPPKRTPTVEYSPFRRGPAAPGRWNGDS
jgi:hypothetical protein